MQKQLKYIFVYCEHLECGKIMERTWNAIISIKLHQSHSHA